MESQTKGQGKVIFITIIVSLLLIYLGNQFVMKDLSFFDEGNDIIVAKAKVLQVLDDTPNEHGMLLFECLVKEGNNAGETIIAGQPIEEMTGANIKLVSKGDVVFLGDASQYQVGTDWFLYEYERTKGLIGLSIAFGVLLIIFGRSKGFRTIISLIYTCLTIFFIFLPSIVSGYNIYVTSLMTCFFIIFSTLLIVQGPSSKALAACLGCVGGIIMVSIITVAMSQILKLSGLIDSDSYFLLYLNTEKPISLKAIVFASIIIGATGAILDIAVDIASSLAEVHRHACNKLTIWQTVKSGINIGQDIMGSMANTLILAYIGSSLSLILLLLVHSGSPQDLFNSELITIEILQALAGSIGILFAIPLTAISCGVLYNRSKES